MLQTWKKLGPFARFFIISFICAILFFTYVYVFEIDFSYWEPKEETYNALEDIMYEIIEEKNYTIPHNEYLNTYSIDTNSYGKIRIILSSHHVEQLYITLDSDFNLIELKRSDTIYAVILSHIVLFYFIGIILSLLLYIIYYSIKYIIIIIKFIIKKFR